MNLSGTNSNLAQALKELRLEWDLTRNDWRDAKAEEFAQRYLDQLPTQVARTVRAIQELELILKKVRSECE
jgi:hypothetical protein